MLKVFNVFAVLMFLTFASRADVKIDRTELANKVLPRVDSIGACQDYPLRYIVEKLCQKDFNETEIIYAMYSWMANNISFNTWDYHHPKIANNSPSETLNKRIATGMGYANLFKAMCDMIKVPCVVIEGDAKVNPQSIGNKKRLLKHAWNAVKIKNSWYLVDVALGANNFDKKIKRVEKDFSDGWCFADRELFMLSHFPVDTKWVLMETQPRLNTLLQAPQVGSGALRNSVYLTKIVKGIIKGNKDGCKRMIFEINDPKEITQVNVKVDDKLVFADFYVDKDFLYVDVPFTKKGKYPLTIMVNGQPGYVYNALVGPKKKGR